MVLFRLAHLSDLHLMERVRFDQAVGTLGRIVDSLRESAVQCVLVTGDLSGRDAPHHSTIEERYALAGFFRKLSNIAPVIIIRGNHDRKGEVSLYERCAGLHPIHAYDDQIEIRHEGVGFFCIPWAPMRSFGHDLGALPREEANALVLHRLMERYERFANGNTPDTLHVILAHSPVANARVGSFEIQSARDVLFTQQWLNETRAQYIALGHIHQRQRVSEAGYYVGSPYPIDFSETYEHGYHLVEISKLETVVTFVPVESWRMLTLHGEWRNDGFCTDPMICPTTKRRLGRPELDNAFVRLKITVPPFLPLENLPLTDIQQAILVQGGYLEPKDIHISRLQQATTLGEVAPPTWTLQERIIESITQNVEDAARRARLRDLAASIA